MVNRIIMDDGSIIEVECNDEVWNGKYLKYFGNGKIQETGQYLNDERVGKFLVYNNDDKNTLRKELIYGNSKDPITVIEYEHINDQLISSSLFENKDLIEIKTYYDNGGIESIKNFKNNKIISYDKEGNILIDKYHFKSEQKFNFNNKGKFADVRELIYKYADNIDLIKQNSFIFIGEDTFEQKFNISRLNQDLVKRNNRLKIIQYDLQLFLETCINLYEKSEQDLSEVDKNFINQIKQNNKLDQLEAELKSCIENNKKLKDNNKNKLKLYFLTRNN